MENASKALIMAAGILIGLLILALMLTLFASAREFAQGYEQSKEDDSIQQFNVNFTKYLGQELTIHQVTTICNFAKLNSVTVENLKIDSIKEVVEDYSTDADSVKKYELEILGYSDTGKINSIKFKDV